MIEKMTIHPKSAYTIYLVSWKTLHSSKLTYSFKSLGVYIINLKKTWEKLLLAARAIVAIENPADVCVISSRNTGQVNCVPVGQ